MFKKLMSPRLTEIIDIHVALLVFRIGAAMLLLTHGFPKVMNVLQGNFQFVDPIGLGPELTLILAALAEGVGAIFILFGFWTRIASFCIVVNMIVAVFIAHAGDPFGRKELAVVYLLIFLFLFFTGSGNYSADRKLA